MVIVYVIIVVIVVIEKDNRANRDFKMAKKTIKICRGDCNRQMIVNDARLIDDKRMPSDRRLV